MKVLLAGVHGHGQWHLRNLPKLDANSIASQLRAAEAALAQAEAEVERIRIVAPWDGVVDSVLAAVSIVALIGLRYPLQMLPLLLFELLWKSIWLLSFAWPLWSTGDIDAGTRETIKACLMGIVIFPISIPWGYVFAHYVRQPSERWKARVVRTA